MAPLFQYPNWNKVALGATEVLMNYIGHFTYKHCLTTDVSMCDGCYSYVKSIWKNCGTSIEAWEQLKCIYDNMFSSSIGCQICICERKEINTSIFG